MLYTEWNYTATIETTVVVMPDGCRDILILEDTHSEPELLLTEWDDRARSVRLERGKKISGFRLRPGMSFDSRDLVNLGIDADEIRSYMDSELASSSEVSDLIEALSDPCKSLQRVARQAGISERTLQRRLKMLGLPKPEYWRLLSRARIAATALPCRVSLVEIANTYGYSDQPHMTREFVRWFGTTPAQLRGDPSLLSEVSQPGLGNWTFEQISIK